MKPDQHKRLEALEETEAPAEQWEVRVVRPVCEPGPNGPKYLGRTHVTEYENGTLIRREIIQESDAHMGEGEGMG